MWEQGNCSYLMLERVIGLRGHTDLQLVFSNIPFNDVQKVTSSNLLMNLFRIDTFSIYCL